MSDEQRALMDLIDDECAYRMLRPQDFRKLLKDVHPRAKQTACQEQETEADNAVPKTVDQVREKPLLVS